MERYIKWVVGPVLVLIVVLIVLGVYAKEVGATYQPSFHTEWRDEGHVKWGACVANAACGTSEGTQTGTQKQGCKLVQGSGSFECQLGHQRYVEVSRSCEVETPVCEEEPVDTCESEEGIQENGCTPEEPETPPVVKEDTPDKPTLHKSQGPNGSLGDGTCQLEWNKIKGSKKVEIRYANDGVFGNGYKSFETKDDGAEWVEGITGENAKVKFRGRDSKTEWSKAINLDC